MEADGTFTVGQSMKASSHDLIEIYCFDTLAIENRARPWDIQNLDARIGINVERLTEC